MNALEMVAYAMPTRMMQNEFYEKTDRQRETSQPLIAPKKLSSTGSTFLATGGCGAGLGVSAGAGGGTVGGGGVTSGGGNVRGPDAVSSRSFGDATGGGGKDGLLMPSSSSLAL